MLDHRHIPPAPAHGEVRRFPAARILRTLPSSDRLVVFHHGRAVAFDAPEDLHQAVRLANPQWAQTAHAAGFAQASAEMEAAVRRRAAEHAAALQRLTAANAVRLRQTFLSASLTGFVIGAAVMIVLGVGQ